MPFEEKDFCDRESLEKANKEMWKIFNCVISYFYKAKTSLSMFWSQETNYSEDWRSEKVKTEMLTNPRVPEVFRIMSWER